MLREILKYTDFDNKPAERVLWFNLTKTELMTNFVLMDRIEKVRDISQEDPRELTPVEKEELVDLVKGVMKLSYGERIGDMHVKSEEAWDRFRWSPAYEEFLYSLFVDEPRAMTWISSIMPQDLRDAVAAERAKLQNSDATSSTPAPEPVIQTLPENIQPAKSQEQWASELPEWIVLNRQPTAEEWAAASQEQIAEAMRRKSQ